MLEYKSEAQNRQSELLDRLDEAQAENQRLNEKLGSIIVREFKVDNEEAQQEIRNL